MSQELRLFGISSKKNEAKIIWYDLILHWNIKKALKGKESYGKNLVLNDKLMIDHFERINYVNVVEDFKLNNIWRANLASYRFNFLLKSKQMDMRGIPKFKRRVKQIINLEETKIKKGIRNNEDQNSQT